MTDREFAETFMKTVYSKTTGKLLFSIYPITKEEIENLEPLVGFPEFEFTDKQKKVYGALQRKYGLHFWKPKERELRRKEYIEEACYTDFTKIIEELRQDFTALEHNVLTYRK